MENTESVGDAPAATVERSMDAAAATRLASGDRSALADLYDRWGDRVHSVCARVLDGNRDEAADATQDTFLIAIDKIGQLRDPERVGPWLLAIARHEAIRRGKRRAKERAVDTTDPVNLITASAEATVVDDVAAVERADVVAVAGDAIASLNAREAALVELHLVQGLTGRDLAAAAGIAHDQLHVAVKRMTSRLGAAVEALYVARHGRGDCEALAAVLDGWDGAFTSVVRKRVARHARDCKACAERARRANPLAAAALVPLIPAPLELRARLVSAIAPVRGMVAPTLSPGAGRFGFDREGFPIPLRGGKKFMWLVGAGVLVVALFGAGVWWAARDGGGGRDTLAALGDPVPTTDAAPLTEDGPPPDAASPTSTVRTTTTSTASSSSVSPENSTTSSPAATAPPSVDPDPPPTPGNSSTTTSTTTTAPPDTTPPTLGSISGETQLFEVQADHCWASSDQTVLQFSLGASDASAMTASARLVDGFGHAPSGSITRTANGFAGSFGPFTNTFGGTMFEVPVTIEVTVVDAAGNQSVRTRPATVVRDCLI